MTLLLLLSASCRTVPGVSDRPSADNASLPIPWSAEEINVLAVLLTHEYGIFLEQGAELVMMERTPGDLLVDTLGEYDELSVGADTVADFKRRNARQYLLPPGLRERLPLRYLALSEMEWIWTEEGGWERFNRLFPASPGLVMVSRVGLSADRKTAIAHIGAQSGSLLGSGRIRVLRCRDGEWVVTDETVGGDWIL